MSGRATAIALTIAGSDSSGGAGIQADLKTFSALGVYGASAITALTAQNTRGVAAVQPVSAVFVVAQIDAVLADLDVGAIKTGMLADRGIVSAVAARLAAAPRVPLIVDPVMIATSGHALLTPDAVAALRTELFPRALMITPNLAEAARLLDAPEARDEVAMVAQARALHEFGAHFVLIKGGHGGGAEAVDILFDGTDVTRFARPRLPTRNSHGTGCTLSAAITALLAARDGPPASQSIATIVARAKQYVWQALQAGSDLRVGSGIGPLDHLYDIRRHPRPV